MSAQRLSEACADLGMAIPRSVLANFEGGRRESVSVAEVFILAAALQVPPLLLAFPLGRLETMEPLPGIEVSPWGALHWAETGRLGSSHGIEPPPYEDAQLIERYRRHQQLVGEWQGGRGREEAIRRFKHGDEQRDEFARLEREQRATVGELGALRELLRKDGLIPPRLPMSFSATALRQALGEDDEGGAS